MKVPWCTVAPINPCYRGDELLLDHPVEFDGGVVLGPIPEWLKALPLIDHLGQGRWNDVIGNARLAFRIEYKANSLGMPDPKWKGQEPRSIQAIAEERIRIANMALWLVKGSRINSEFLVHAEKPNGGWLWRHWETRDPVRPTEEEAINELTAEDFTLARKLHASILALTKEGAVWIAMRVLSTAIQEGLWEYRFLLHWILLEVLFGTRDPGEITYRLSHRIGFFLGRDREHAHEIAKNVKESYRWRSKAVHGMRLAKLNEDKSLKLMDEVQGFVRTSVTKILTDRKLISTFGGKDREKFLDDLVYSD